MTAATGTSAGTARRLLILLSALAITLSAMILTQAQPATAASCARGHVCVYDNAGWTTLLLDINGAGGSRVYFPEGRRNRASSYINNSNYDWCARDQRTARPDIYLFTLFANDDSYYVGHAVNDNADYLYPC